MSPFMTLSGQRIQLELQQPAEVLQWVSSLPAEVRSEISPAWLSAVSRLTTADPWYCMFQIRMMAGGVVAGSCAFKGPPDEFGAVELAYGVEGPWQGQGIATEAVRLLLKFCRGQSAVQSVIGHTVPDNAGSARVLEKCGFVCCGPVQHPEDGEVNRWELVLCSST